CPAAPISTISISASRRFRPPVTATCIRRPIMDTSLQRLELFTGIFSMSLMTGLIFARFSRPSARLLFADHPVISSHEGKPTLMIRFVNERHNIIGNATAKLWLLRNEVSLEGGSFRRFYELALVRSEHPALALSWTLYH